uniref:Uncharacterized protein n=1 Tax=Anguilla anguilla TaxID=7936 RepID=A0A0E9U0B6_ANGAN
MDASSLTLQGQRLTS